MSSVVETGGRDSLVALASGDGFVLGASPITRTRGGERAFAQLSPLIVYHCPNAIEPFGGVRLILRHAEMLNRSGIATQVYVRSSERLSDWLEAEREKIVRRLPPDSVEVLPETEVEALARPGPKVMLVQSFGFLSACPLGIRWNGHPVQAVIAVSQAVKTAVHRRFGLPATVISPAVDAALFKPGPKELLVTYMPRRNKIGIDEILALAKISDSSCMPIHGVPHAEVARRLSRSTIFLAAGYSEGFGLPALEAMASGCLVVGFAGGGGLDFMKDGVNCLLAEDGNNELAAERLKLAIRLVSENRHHSLVENATQTARRFSPEREEREVLRFWRGFLSGDPRTTPQGGPCWSEI